MDNITALDQAKITLFMRPDSVFLTTILFSLKTSFSDSVATACTDGLSLLINPEFFMKLDSKERVFLLAHEAYHVAFQHMCRLGTRNFRIWNMACDYVINYMLVNISKMKMIEGALYNEKYKDMSSEEIYDHLMKNVNQIPLNFTEDFSVPDKDDASKVQHEIDNIICKAYIQAKVAGDSPSSIPGDIHAYMDKLLKPKLPWNIILQNYLTSFSKSDFSFRKPNRRLLPDFYLPTMYTENLGKIAIAIDTSGSVTQEQFDAFLTEVRNILITMEPEEISLISFDTRIRDVVVIKDLKDVPVKFTGRGGTDIKDLVSWMDENKPQVTIIFTDGEFRKYDTNPHCPTIWAIHSNDNFSYPWGKVIQYPIN